MNEWISVKDRLPDENLMVLGYTPCDGYMFVGFRETSIFGNNEWYIITAMRSTKTMRKKVTHWMPLPELPTEDDQDA